MKCAITLLLILTAYCVYIDVTRAQDDVLGLFPEYNKLRNEMNDMKKRVTDMGNRVIDMGNHQNCRTNKQGLEYKGTMSMTKTGKTCQAWNSNTPHAVNTVKYGQLVNEGNYCRGTADESEPWCYTTDPSIKWEHCDIPYCATPSLGFTVVTPSKVTYQKHETIKFSEVVFSSLTGYDSSTGVFTAPMDGTYLFILSARTLGTSECWLTIMKNGVNIDELFMRSYRTYDMLKDPSLSDSSSVVLSIKKGDKISGNTYYSAKCLIDEHSTFTGVYL